MRSASTLVRWLEHVPFPVFCLDRDLRCVYANLSVRNIVGLTSGQCMGKAPVEAGVDPSLWESIEPACRNVLSTGEPRRVSIARETAKGRRHCDVWLCPRRDARGRIEGLVGSAADATARRRAESALRESEKRFSALVDQVRDYAIFAVDLEGRVTSWNVGVERVLGWSRDEFIGLSLEKLFAPADVEAGVPERELEEAAREGSVSNDLWLMRKDGTPFFAAGMTTRVVDENGRVIGFSKVLRDNTAWKQAQEERDALLLSERRARQEAERANRLKEEFLATLSHELRSPLNAILGWAYIGRRQSSGNAELEHALETIERNARAQARLIDDLLDMSRIIASEVTLEMRPVRLQELVGEAVEAIRPAARRKSISIDYSLEASVPSIATDPERLQQALGHLLANAVKFTPESGHVSVTLTQVDSGARISVRDTGVGIRSEFLPYVFDHFRQADSSTTRRFGGLGLGLSIVKSIVDLLGGTVEVTSPGEGQGATFVISLPLS